MPRFRQVSIFYSHKNNQQFAGEWGSASPEHGKAAPGSTNDGRASVRNITPPDAVQMILKKMKHGDLGVGPTRSQFNRLARPTGHLFPTEWGPVKITDARTLRCFDPIGVDIDVVDGATRTRYLPQDVEHRITLPLPNVEKEKLSREVPQNEGDGLGSDTDSCQTVQKHDCLP